MTDVQGYRTSDRVLRFLCLIVLIMTGLLLSCSPVGSNEEIKQDTMTDQFVFAFSGRQTQVGDLLIGADYIQNDDYTDTDGTIRHGPTAKLWIYVRDDSSQNQQVTVHVGQELSLEDYDIRVADIRVGEDVGSVRLTVKRRS